jgi:hypothetical protein
MSLPVHERLAELSADVEQVRLAPAADIRARGRSRARRRRAGTAVGIAVVVTSAGFGLTSVFGGTPQPVATLPAGPLSSCASLVDLTLPGSPSEVEITVVGGTEQAGQVAGELDKRGFTATGGSSDPDAGSPGAVAVLRYGPQAIGAATVVRAFLDGDAVMTFQPDRTGRTVDLVVGDGFRGLATTTQVNQNLVAAGEPTRPPECR